MVDVEVAPSTIQIEEGLSDMRNEPGSLLAFAYEFATRPPATVPPAAVIIIRKVLK